MRKQIVTIVLGATIVLGTATALFAQNGQPTGGYPPVAGGANGNPEVISYTMSNGKVVQLRTMKVHGHKMIMVPMDMACDVFHAHC
jgi:hypothetical protein